MTETAYTAKDITVLEGLEPVRMRPGMYIGSVDSPGLHHLLWEIVDNSVDEAMNGHCKRIDVVLEKDGETISVFDNNNLATWQDGMTRPDRTGQYSRVVRLTRGGAADVLFSGQGDPAFFTDIMGSHQRLPNGNLLLVETIEGRVIEVDAQSNPVWEYINVVGDERVGVVVDAAILPGHMDEAFFRKAATACASSE